MNAPLTSAQQESAYLAQLGERVRAWRNGHGMTRKALAAASGVSERYLAQLEAGQGNISVLLLRKLAHAMHVSVESLVREGAEQDPARRRIALLGLRWARNSPPPWAFLSSNSTARSSAKPGPNSAKCSRCTARKPSAASSGGRSNG